MNSRLFSYRELNRHNLLRKNIQIIIYITYLTTISIKEIVIHGQLANILKRTNHILPTFFFFFFLFLSFFLFCPLVLVSDLILLPISHVEYVLQIILIVVLSFTFILYLLLLFIYLFIISLIIFTILFLFFYLFKGIIHLKGMHVKLTWNMCYISFFFLSLKFKYTINMHSLMLALISTESFNKL